VIYAIADNILSPLGSTTKENFEAVLRAQSRISSYAQVHGHALMEPFVGSLMGELPQIAGYSAFEAMCIRSAEAAIRDAELDAAADDCLFVVSTTKGNIWDSPAESAARIAGYFGNRVRPVVVSTACTSGVSAQVVAHRLLAAGRCKTAVVVGCDVQTPFIVSGFQSFKALSAEPCRPFDAKRSGLNAGEAAATLILQRSDEQRPGAWQLLVGSIHNDANHISGPSRTAEGSLRCLEDALALLPAEELAFVSVHGTGTAYNDEMESIALFRAGLSEVPVSALKGNYGHTMGAAGLLETILSMHAASEGVILPSKGYQEQGTTYPVNLSQEPRTTDKRAFIKLLSGFGGVNAAVAWRKINDNTDNILQDQHRPAPFDIVESTQVELSSEKGDDLVALFRERVGGYPKFFKMDMLSRLGFLATELLLQQTGETLDSERTALIFANRSSSVKNDTDYQATISDPDNYYPSPALFVYTLPNIVTGEVAIRQHLYGETAFYVLQEETDMQPLVETTMAQPSIDSAIVAWLECRADGTFEAKAKLIKKTKKNK